MSLTGHVKLTGVTFIGELSDSHPRVRIFKDRELNVTIMLQYVYKLMINHFISQFSFDSVTAAKPKPDQEMQLKQDNSVTILFTSINKCLRLWRMEFSSHFGNLCVISPMFLVKMII